MRNIIEKALGEYLLPGNRDPKALHMAMRYSVFSGGKRIRPLIVIESCKACGGDLKDAIPAACAVEFVHTYSLIHDDLPCMDDDDYRRGKPTSHKVFGEAIAVLAGDALLTLAFDVIARHGDPKRGLRMASELAGAIGSVGMVGGQVLDVGLDEKVKIKAKREIARINDLKTAKLFEVAARLGAISSGVSAKKIDAMARYGLYFGRAFQIADDIADNGDYVKAFGMDKAKSDFCRTIDKARRSLTIFGRKADGLREIAGRLG